MPLPTPQAEESQEDFINRCMGDEDVQKEAEGMEERNAICFSQWEQAGETEAEIMPEQEV